MDQIYWIVLASFIMPLFLGFGLTWFFIKYNKRQAEYLIERKETELREQKLLLEKEQELNKERNRIAAEMHDELGGGLTAIRYLGHRAKKHIKTEKAPDIIDRMVDRSAVLINNMSEIIWAMNSHYDSLKSLISFVRSYARRFCQDCSLQYAEEAPTVIFDWNLSGEIRRNIFLTVKEALNNVAKHAEASSVELKIELNEDFFWIEIRDNGIGFQREKKEFSNGMRSMNYRMKQIGGNFDLHADQDGTRIKITYPLTENTYE